jgi:hypothetical protein
MMPLAEHYFTDSKNPPFYDDRMRIEPEVSMEAEG